MSLPQTPTSFHAQYPLGPYRRGGVTAKAPASHQSEAIRELEKWFATAPSSAPRGGILVLPTGGGKTFTATRFACQSPLSAGFKVLWLAHTHHLLEQAFFSFEHTACLVAEPAQHLSVRVVSGTVGHYPVHTIRHDDDVVIGSLQTIVNAVRNRHAQFDQFLDAARGRLFVIFDEAHHAPAPSYRNLICWLRERCPGSYFLGLTATPLSGDENKSGWLRKLFPQNILSQTTANALMSRGILSRPIIEEVRTTIAPDFDEREYETWKATHTDLPEGIIGALARSQERNDAIVARYVRDREKYGKTLIFADRWYQCEYLRESLLSKGVRADAVYSHVEADLGSVEARNRRTAAENARVLQRFRDGELDVLINVRMLAEGTDVPDVRTVFLTRQTTSSILLTQMVGRALRGPKFGGTADAYIVSFIDEWKHRINWASYHPLEEGRADERIEEYARRPPLHLVSIELVRRLARQMDDGSNINPGPFESLLPCGWYLAGFTSRVGDTDDLDKVRQMVLVFDSDRPAFERFLAAVRVEDLTAFEGEDVRLDDIARPRLAGWRDASFPAGHDRIGGGRLEEDLFGIVRHLAQNGAEPPFFPFDSWRDHDLDAVAQGAFDRDLGPRAQEDVLMAEYGRADRHWRIFYPNFGQFRVQYQGCMNRIVDSARSTPVLPPLPTSPPPPLPEPAQRVKDEVLRRDGYRCLCCGYDKKSKLQVDHIVSRYHGGSHDPENLQTLCEYCNTAKGTAEVRFGRQSTPLDSPPAAIPEVVTPRIQATDRSAMELHFRRAINLFYRCGAVREVVATGWGDRHHWRISLFAGNDPLWIRPHEDALLDMIQRVRRDVGYQAAPLAVTFTT